MNRSEGNSGWGVIGALSLALTGPAHAADTQQEDTGRRSAFCASHDR